ncbi:putative rhamnosyl transferase [Ancylobacter sp. Lp-2]|uniref:glycosyltransferase n=1 Tax=Ancylobacter sp. Lp-2 TaxID=2881339 RepID=UPI001E5F3D3D|nr:glycosyltransferase [Ancylobacter sp. Lp-2]MCB4769423.1 putative rhamnosyl transferase [Ancylobacter sp. Lp-2]
MSVTFVGVTRFSVVTRDSLTWFRSTRDLSLEQAKETVFDTGRLQQRLRMFSRYALPTYVALTRRERSYAAILINHDLPSFAVKSLKKLLAPHPNIRLAVIGEGHSFRLKSRNACARLAEGGRLYSYRLDDDDALSPGYFDAIAPQLDQLPDLTVISAPEGRTIAPAPDEVIQVQECSIKHVAQGLGVVSGPDRYLSAYDLGNHMVVYKKYPVQLIATGRPLWLRTRHIDNDSPTRRGPPPVNVALAQASVDLKKDFPFINLAALRVLSPPAPAPAPQVESAAS